MPVREKGRAIKAGARAWLPRLYVLASSKLHVYSSHSDEAHYHTHLQCGQHMSILRRLVGF